MCGGNGKPTNTIITLTVDTANINETNKNLMITFTDDQGDTETPGQPGQFESVVNKNSTITWKGVAKNGTDTISITDVSKKTTGGGSDILQEIGNPKDGIVTARVKNQQVTGDEFYNISLDVSGTVYTIDPRLKMR